jgi:hypothetical protein
VKEFVLRWTDLKIRSPLPVCDLDKDKARSWLLQES